MEISKEEILKIVDRCFHIYASDYRNYAKKDASEMIEELEQVKKLTIPIEVEDEVRIVKHEKKGKVVYILPFGSDNIAVKDIEGNTDYYKESELRKI